MRRVGFLLLAGFLISITACNDNRVYEKNKDFENQYWLISDRPEFEFSIDDTLLSYNLYCDVRNEISYPKTNLYFTYYLSDSSNRLLQKKLISDLLFDKKTGEPFGNSALGDIYDRQILLLRNYKFKQAGKYTIKLEQFMRMDTLRGILAVGVRVEKSLEKE